jgi:HEAT repeat protein
MLARAILGVEPELRRTALAAATATARGEYRRAGAALPVPDGMVSAAEVLRDLAPRGYTKNEQARALSALREPLAKEALAAVATSPERARVEGLLTSASGTIESATARELAGVSEAIAKQSVNGFVALARHPSVDVRKSAVEFLARRREPEAQRALASVLSDRDPEVCKTALASMTGVSEPDTIAAVVALVQKSESWSIRAHAARALGRMGKVERAESNAAIDQALRKAAVSDAFALVREAALVSLVTIDRAAAAKILQQVASGDAEPRVRERARELAREARP